MKLLKQINDNVKAAAALVAEDAAGGAVGAGAVGAMAMPLFATLVKQKMPAKGKKVKFIMSPLASTAVNVQKRGLGLAEAFSKLHEFSAGGDATSANDVASGNGSNFDSTEVISKLKGLENKEKIDHRDTVSFGLEDDQGNTVKVTVKKDQAEDFEKALQTMLVNREDDPDDVPEIAEVLFKLKDQFDIVDVAWPDIEEDEEENVSLANDSTQSDSQGGSEDGSQSTDTEGQPDQANGDDLDLDADQNAGMPDAGGSSEDVQGLLTQVIDMMKADAEARKAEARAREAEAKGKEASALVAQTMARVKQEEQYLDMDSYNKAKKEESREAKRLAQLAKWKHDMNQQNGGTEEDDEGPDSADLPLVPNREAPEEEERSYRTHMRRPPQERKPKRVPPPKSRVHPYDIAEFIIGRVKS